MDGAAILAHGSDAPHLPVHTVGCSFALLRFLKVSSNRESVSTPFAILVPVLCNPEPHIAASGFVTRLLGWNVLGSWSIFQSCGPGCA